MSDEPPPGQAAISRLDSRSLDRPRNALAARALAHLDRVDRSQQLLERLFAAIGAGDALTVDQLITAEPHLICTRRKQDGATCLHAAAWHSHASIVSILLKAGADPNARLFATAFGSTPLTLAATAGHAGYFAHAASSFDVASTEASIAEVVRELLAAGADVNVDDTLCTAIGFNLLSIATLLLDAGAAVNVPANDLDAYLERSPLMHAIYAESAPSVALLLERGADPASSHFPMHEASLCVNGEVMIPLLIRYGADPHVVDPETGMTPLQHLLNHGTYDMHWAGFSPEDKLKYALFGLKYPPGAAFSKALDTLVNNALCLFLEGADCAARDSTGRSPMDIARASRWWGMLSTDDREFIEEFLDFLS